MSASSVSKWGAKVESVMVSLPRFLSSAATAAVLAKFSAEGRLKNLQTEVDFLIPNVEVEEGGIWS